MKNGKKVLALIMAVLMLATMVAGCGGTQNKADSTTAATTAAIAETTAAAETTAEPAKELEGTVTINTQAGVGAAEAWQAAADGYMALHPKVKVVVDLKPAESYGEWIKNMYGTENPTADIVNINMAGPAKIGKSVNFMEYANTKSPYSDGVWTDQFNFEMQTKDLARNEWDNLSLESVQVLWCYNKDIFTKVGVQPPTTWKEFVAVCEKLTTAGYQPISMAGDFNSFWSGQMGCLLRFMQTRQQEAFLKPIEQKMVTIIMTQVLTEPLNLIFLIHSMMIPGMLTKTL